MEKEPFILAMIGGVGYCLTAYSAFHYVPAAHAAIFLNGCIPVCTAIAAWMLFRVPFDRHTWISIVIMLTAIAGMSALMYQETGVAFGLGDGLFFISAIWWGVFTVLLRQWKLFRLACYGGCRNLVGNRLCPDLRTVFPENNSARLNRFIYCCKLFFMECLW